MQKPQIPANEAHRLATIRTLRVLESSSQGAFDRITRIASRLFDVPIVLVSIVDENRQWFKSKVGLEVSETHRDISFCGHAILGDDIFEVNDTFEDERFNDNPLVTGKPNIRFYAGRPLKAQNGAKLGTLCLIDRKPNQLTIDHKLMLNDLAELVEREMTVSHLSTVDDLTQLYNRRGFMLLCRHQLQLVQRGNGPSTIVYMDLDRFKPINDIHGHAEGDQVLQGFAEGLEACFRDSDIISRLGGDEFVVFQPNCNEQNAFHAIERLHQFLNKWLKDHNKKYSLDFSAGIITCAANQFYEIEDLLIEADIKMYEAKRKQVEPA